MIHVHLIQDIVPNLKMKDKRFEETVKYLK